MLRRFTLLTLGLLAVIVISACAPKTSAPPASPPPAPTVELSDSVQPSPAPATEESAPAPGTESPDAAGPTAESAPVVVTPRGNQLEATDPSMVNLASGRPQLIEFFAFW
ncbi:MAG: hypothetical protein GXP40_05595 [Chloroflexi bacterium]|nr:hypothetical protein [Chloroflexota bacterium]